MSRVKTFTNGGSLLPGDLNSIEDDYELAFSTYKTITQTRGGVLSGAPPSTGVQVLSSASVAPLPGGGFQTVLGVWLDPADYNAGSRVTKLRLRGVIATNTVTPGQTYTFGLYPVTTTFGASGSGNLYNVGAVVAGSTAAVATPGGSTVTAVTSTDVACPAAGLYFLGVNVASAGTAGARVDAAVALQVRQV